jgi:uncharacterized membrane protein SpoIIM required for sporulation
MEPYLFYTITISLYGLTLLIACFFSSISLIFGFISALFGMNMLFTYPGFLYYYTYKQFKPTKTDKSKIFMSIFFIWFGIFMCVFSLTSEILKITYQWLTY